MLPIIAHYLRLIGTAQVVDCLCPSAPQATVSHADAVVALVANRLTAPRPLYRVEEWAAEYGVEEFLGLDSASLNDDRLAAALDEVVDYADEIQAGVALQMQERCGLDLSEIHLDWTKVIFHGLYENQNPDFAQVLVGAPSPTVPQGTKTMNAEMATCGDGGVPVRMKAHSGNQADVTTVIAAFDWLKGVAAPSKFVLVGDCKLLSRANEHHMLLNGCDYVAPMQWSQALEDEYLKLPEEDWRLLTYMSERESLRSPAERRRFWGQELELEVLIPIDKAANPVASKRDKAFHEFRTFKIRKVFIRSEEEMQAARKSRQKRIEKTDAELKHLQETARNYRTVVQLSEKVRKLLEKRKLTSLYTCNVTGPDVKGRPLALHVHHNEAALAGLEKADGWYVLRTPLPQESSSMDEVLSQYKRQSRLESRFADYKGPLAVSPTYLKTNKRAAGLLLVVMLALQVYTLIERDLRKTLAAEGGRMAGLYPEGRLSRPTTRQILRVFEQFGMSWLHHRGHSGWVLDPLTETQQDILSKLGVDLPSP